MQRMEKLFESVRKRIRQKMTECRCSGIAEDILLKDPDIGPDLKKCLRFFDGEELGPLGLKRIVIKMKVPDSGDVFAKVLCSEELDPWGVPYQ